MQALFDDWQFSSFVGATPSVPYAHLTVSVKIQFDPFRWQAVWQAARAMLGRASERQPGLLRWSKLASDGYREDEAALTIWLKAMLRLASVPDYPLVAECSSEGRLKLVIACPYFVPMREAIAIVAGFLNWCETPDRSPAWLPAFGKWPARIPPRPVMAWHYQLWQQGVTWQWLGGVRTRVGQGVRQRIVEGVPAGEIPSGQAHGQDWRIPIYTVTGSVGKTTTARLLAQLLAGSTECLALTASDGAWVGDQRLLEGDCIGGTTAQALLQHPGVSAAVFEQGRGGMLRQGVPYRISDVAILLNVQDVHIGREGVDSMRAMADVKSVGLRPARIVVLNLDDAECRRLGGLRPIFATVWFSTVARAESLQALSRNALGALGIQRDDRGEALAVEIWQGGNRVRQLGLEGVAPFHGLLGEKTLEELLAVVAAGWFGPLPVEDWDHALRRLHLDQGNHLFRASVHQRGNVTFVLDKAAEESSINGLREITDEICRQQGIGRRILLLRRSAVDALERHHDVCRHFYRFMDEFICYDLPETYLSKWALPEYAPGSLSGILRDEFQRQNAEHGTDKPVLALSDWAEVEVELARRLASVSEKVLVLVNQPTTANHCLHLNRRIVQFVDAWPAPPETESENKS